MIADGVTKSFGQVVAIEDVGFKVEEHEFLAVLGPSGSGKTTLFRCLTGLLLPDRGTVRIDDHDVTTLRGGSRRRIAVVFQQFNLVNRLTAFQNVLAGHHSARTICPEASINALRLHARWRRGRL